MSKPGAGRTASYKCDKIITPSDTHCVAASVIYSAVIQIKSFVVALLDHSPSLLAILTAFLLCFQLLTHNWPPLTKWLGVRVHEDRRESESSLAQTESVPSPHELRLKVKRFCGSSETVGIKSETIRYQPIILPQQKNTGQ